MHTHKANNCHGQTRFFLVCRFWCYSHYYVCVSFKEFRRWNLVHNSNCFSTQIIISFRFVFVVFFSLRLLFLSMFFRSHDKDVKESEPRLHSEIWRNVEKPINRLLVCFNLFFRIEFVLFWIYFWTRYSHDEKKERSTIKKLLALWPTLAVAINYTATYKNIFDKFQNVRRAYILQLNVIACDRIPIYEHGEWRLPQTVLRKHFIQRRIFLLTAFDLKRWYGLSNWVYQSTKMLKAIKAVWHTEWNFNGSRTRDDEKEIYARKKEDK